MFIAAPSVSLCLALLFCILRKKGFLMLFWRSISRHGIISFIIGAVLLIAIALPALAVSSSARAEAVSKIHRWVIDHTANGQSAEFLVVLADQADLSGAAKLITKQEKGRYVYTALYKKAQETQRPIAQWLTDRSVVWAWNANRPRRNSTCAPASTRCHPHQPAPVDAPTLANPRSTGRRRSPLSDQSTRERALFVKARGSDFALHSAQRRIPFSSELFAAMMSCRISLVRNDS
ncbi:MAG: hypothetical protein HGB05_01850 [Chloroflexi bacterium]|nr:hypothetical protein [Chloroflexota bacterium]